MVVQLPQMTQIKGEKSKKKVKIDKIEEFLKFQIKTRNFKIWKLHLSDLKKNFIFFEDRESLFKKNKFLEIFGIKTVFYRGKKIFIGRKVTPITIFSQDKKTKIFRKNMSLIEHKII